MLKKKKSVKRQAEENLNVTKGTKDNQRVVKQGIPLDHSRKHLSSNTIGANMGYTMNMGDYESMRADVWATVDLEEGQSLNEGFNKLIGFLDKKLKEALSYYASIEDEKDE